LKNKKEAELQDKIETEKITPLVASAEATTEEVKLA
jgi:hypothetical protein